MIHVECTRGEVKNPGDRSLKMLAEGRQQVGKSKKKQLGWKEENLRNKGQEAGMIRGIICCTWKIWQRGGHSDLQQSNLPEEVGKNPQ